VIIVGDTPHDISGAHEIGAKCIGIPYRNNDMAVLQKAGADRVVSTVDHTLVDAVQKLLSECPH
jgi:phosphoglycolate phosphatase